MSLQRTTTTMVLALFAVTLLLSGCGKEGKDSTPGDGKKGGDGGTPNAQGTPITVNAKQLAKDYATDAKAADAKYKDKMLETEGIVNVVVRDTGKVHVSLLGHKKKETDIIGLDVHCVMAPATWDKAVLLGKGQKVKVTGKAAGSNPLAVYLMDCTLTELSENPTLKVTAEELSEAFAKDRDTAEKKYKDKEVIVEGKVADLVKKDNFGYAKLAGKDTVRVSCTIVDAKEFAALKKGDQVRIKGDCTLFFDNEVDISSAWVLKNK